MMKKLTTDRWLRALFLFLLFVLSALLFSACGEDTENPYSPEIPEPIESFYVYDAAGVLSPADEAYLIARSEALFALTGAQIVTVCVPDTGSLDIADYARQLFNKWNVGSAQRNNGVLLLLSTDADDYWLLPGKGLEDALPNSELKTMNNSYLEPHFADAEYADGVRALFDALLSRMETMYSIDVDTWSGAPGTFTQERAPEEANETQKQSSPLVTVLMIVILAVIAVLIVVILLLGSGGPGRGRRRKAYAAASRSPARPVHRSGYYTGTVPPHGSAAHTGVPRQGGNTPHR